MSEAEYTGISELREPLRALDARAIRYWRLRLLAETAAVWVAVLLLQQWLDWLAVIPLSVLVPVIGVALALVWPPLQYRSWGFRPREADLYVQRGVLTRTVSIIPHRRIPR